MEIKKIEFSETFSKAFTIYKGVLLYGVVMVIIYVIFTSTIDFALSLLFGTKDIDAEFQQKIVGNSQNPQKIKNLYIDYFTSPIMIYEILLSILLSTLVYPLSAGYIYMCKQFSQHGRVDFRDLLRGYNGNHFGNLMILYIIYIILGTVLKLMFLLPGIYFWIACIIAMPFVMFHNNNAIEAIKNSFKVMKKNWFAGFLLMSSAYLFAMVGIVAFCIGILFTIPFIYVMIYTIYEETVGKEENTEINEIGIQ